MEPSDFLVHAARTLLVVGGSLLKLTDGRSYELPPNGDSGRDAPRIFWVDRVTKCKIGKIHT